MKMLLHNTNNGCRAAASSVDITYQNLLKERNSYHEGKRNNI